MLKLVTEAKKGASNRDDLFSDQMAESSSEPIRFDRRRDPRHPVSGWAQVICPNPYRTFLGGSMKLIDITDDSIGFISDHQIKPGETVEIRLAPFRVRGRIGTVARCEPCNDDPIEKPNVRYKVGVCFEQKIAA